MSSSDLRLEGRVALVTGAGTGIGRATALLFAREGARIGVNVHRSVGEGRETVAEIARGGGRALLLEADVTCAGDAERMVRSLLDEFGRLDILVNNSGIGAALSPDRAVEILEEDWDRVIDVNLKGALLTSKYALPPMIRQGKGSIVNVSSIRGLLGNPNLAAYCSSKGGMVLLTKQMALDYANFGVRVNCLCPGFVETGMFRTYLAKQDDPERARACFEGMAPMNRVGRPEEIASAALFFASDASSFVTGAALAVDGGYTANGVRDTG